MDNPKIYRAIGLMSGSSLDGLDICYTEFIVHSPQSTVHRTAVDCRPWTVDYTIINAECVAYDRTFRNKLKSIGNSSALEFAQLHTELGNYFGRLTHDFIERNNIEEIDFICSHGQTVFHQPHLGFTSQIGCGAQIAAHTNCKVICDLRSSDVAYGGQGAPIVPVAEKYLFPDHKIFLNIGGIANISFHEPVGTHGMRPIIAYDVCAANTVLNYLAQKKEMDFDKDGILARNGKIIQPLLEELNNIAFCKQPAPKSLGTEHILKDWIPLFDQHKNSIEDKLATAIEHIAIQIGKEINSQIPNPKSQILITGGGALNKLLIERIQHHSPVQTDLPDQLTIQFKEALAMAFIGLLRILERPNCLSSVTGAKKDVTGGAVYLP